MAFVGTFTGVTARAESRRGLLSTARPTVSSSASSFVAPAALKRASVAKHAGGMTMVEAADTVVPAALLKQTGDDFKDLCINSIRFLSIDGVEKANSGHPGMPMGMAPAAYTLFQNYMTFNPKNPNFVNRDRFVLSAGHGSMLIYSLLYLYGYDSVNMDDLQNFRQLGSRTPGHPENFETAGVEVTTGPLGQGVCNAVGIAMAEAHIAATYNKPGFDLVDNYTYAIMGDGCVMEGISGEACSLAGHLGLGKLIVLYDDNNISIDGNTDISFTEDVGKRYEAYGWQVINVPNGNVDTDAIAKAIEDGKACTDKPTLIKVTTMIGFGSPNKSDSHDSHGAALGKDEVEATREYLGWKHPEFEVPQKALDHFRSKVDEGAEAEKAWNAKFAEYKSKFPELGAQFESGVLKGELPSGWEAELKAYGEGAKANATRKLSEASLQVLAKTIPNWVGGSADLAPSNLTIMEGYGDFQKATPEGRNLRFGVREHGMGAICNGIVLSGYNLLPYCATFFIFTDYMRAAMRLAALSQVGVVYTMTHDSVALGEDGPTHQPIEHLASYRAMPNINMYRPADPVEVAAAYAVGVESRKTPTIIALTRQGTKKLENGSYEGAKKGAYVLSDNSSGGAADLCLMATGSEVDLAVDAAEELRKSGKTVRVVSMPCWERFELQDESYKQSVLPDAIPLTKRLSVEAMSSFGWAKYAGSQVSIDTFGASGPGPAVMKLFNMTVENVVAKASAL